MSEASRDGATRGAGSHGHSPAVTRADTSSATQLEPQPPEPRLSGLYNTLDMLRGSNVARPDPSAGLDVLRSSQLDAARLDNELSLMLKDQFMAIFSFFPAGTVSRFHPELVALLDLAIFRLSVWEGKPLPGMALMNLRHRDERAVVHDPLTSGRTGVEGPGLTRGQRVLYGLGSVGLRYAWARVGRQAAAGRWSESGDGRRHAVLKTLRHADTAYRLASLVNLLAFLRAGKYRSLLERALSARAVYGEAVAARSISFEYLNRQLVWSELSEVLLFLLPLVDMQATKRAVRRWLPAVPSVLRSRGPAASACDAESAHEPCAICEALDAPIRVRAQPCGHVCCYHCLRSATEADAEFRCAACLAPVEAMRRVVVR